MKYKQFNNLIKDLSVCDKCTNFKCSNKTLINIYIKIMIFVLIFHQFGPIGLIG